MNAIAYIRCAATDSSGQQLQKQEIEIKLYCRQNGLKLLQTFTDNGKSGLNFEREGWTELKDHLEKYKDFIQYLIVADLDRIGRDFSLTTAEMQHLEKDLGITIRTVIDPLIGERKTAPLQDFFIPPAKKKMRRRK